MCQMWGFCHLPSRASKVRVHCGVRRFRHLPTRASKANVPRAWGLRHLRAWTGETVPARLTLVSLLHPISFTHPIYTRYCRECGGNGFCEHQRRKGSCRKCKELRLAKAVGSTLIGMASLGDGASNVSGNRGPLLPPSQASSAPSPSPQQDQ